MVNQFNISTNALTTSIDKTTEAVNKLGIGTNKAGDSMISYQEKMDLMEKSTQKELMAIEARERWHMKIKEKQKKSLRLLILKIELCILCLIDMTHFLTLIS